MDEAQKSKGIVRQFLGAVELGDIDTIEALQSVDCRWWVLGGGDLTRAQYTDAVKQMLLAADPRKVEIISMIAEGGTVAAEVRSSMHFGDNVYANEYHDLFIVKDGQIVEGREYFDTAKVAAFFGEQA